MSNRHEKSLGRQIPPLVHGHGSQRTGNVDDDPEMKLDDKSGLWIPEKAHKERRKPPVGFNLE